MLLKKPLQKLIAFVFFHVTNAVTAALINAVVGCFAGKVAAVE